MSTITRDFVILASRRQFHDELIHFQVQDSRKFYACEPTPRSGNKLADVNTPVDETAGTQIFFLCCAIRSYAYGWNCSFFSSFSFFATVTAEHTSRRGETARNACLRRTRRMENTIRKICVLLAKRQTHLDSRFSLENLIQGVPKLINILMTGSL